MAEKTEKATPKKLRDARKKGQVAKSQDFPAAFTFIVSISAALALSLQIYETIASYTIALFKSVPAAGDLENRIGSLMTSAIQVIFSTSVPLMALVALIGIIVNFLIIGPLFSLESMKPDIKRLNPVSNLKNIFKLKTFVELLKSIFKISGALILIYTVVQDSLPDIIATCGQPILVSTIVFAKFLKQVVLRVGLFFIVIAVFDLVFQKKNFQKEMKMEKFEVKQEYKDSEGDPHIKGKRRQIAQEIAYQDGPGSAKRAKAIITNPTHIAVAIEYNAVEEPAPKIVTMGADLVAEQIIKVGLDNNVPIMRNVDLAQTLYYKSVIGGYVPEETYSAISEILKWVAKLEEEKEEESILELFNK
ncbi:MAG: EscU/YscU/HrcU family type III secretion system export apparatus switch protein [Chlamydiae bacterium]|jgi:type III secretion protein U|nr:EscU/YscU/HrcU family type III secretion system export apparatus switch protein [Chlamydiota bacterium]